MYLGWRYHLLKDRLCQDRYIPVNLLFNLELIEPLKRHVLFLTRKAAKFMKMHVFTDLNLHLSISNRIIDVFNGIINAIISLLTHDSNLEISYPAIEWTVDKDEGTPPYNWNTLPVFHSITGLRRFMLKHIEPRAVKGDIFDLIQEIYNLYFKSIESFTESNLFEKLQLVFKEFQYKVSKGEVCTFPLFEIFNPVFDLVLNEIDIELELKEWFFQVVLVTDCVDDFKIWSTSEIVSLESKINDMFKEDEGPPRKRLFSEVVQSNLGKKNPDSGAFQKIMEEARKAAKTSKDKFEKLK